MPPPGTAAVRLLESVSIPDPVQRLSSYPHQLSGGMRQRVMIARALSCHPRLLIADEPTTALDVTVQAQIVELLRELRETEELAVLFVTHDLALMSELSDEIVVMYAGQVVEQATTAELFARPRHPYTAALLAAQPGVRDASGRSSSLIGNVPQATEFPPGCRFHPRCPYAEDACRHEAIPLEAVSKDRTSRCRRLAKLELPGRRQQADRAARRRQGASAVTVPTTGVSTSPVSDKDPVAELRGVSCHFTVRLPKGGKGTVHAADDVDLAVAARDDPGSRR